MLSETGAKASVRISSIRVRLSLGCGIFKRCSLLSCPMSDSDPFRYRVKYKDIRVNPPADEASRARAKQTRVCDEPGCDLEGAHPAPRQNGKGRHFFCDRHVTEYNRRFNFFEGMSEAEAASFVRSERYGHKRTWRFEIGRASCRERV